MLLKHLKVIPRTSSTRLILLYSFLYISSSLLLLSLLFWASNTYIHQQVDHHIEFDRKTLVSIYRQFGKKNFVASIKERIMNESYDSIYLLYDDKMKILGGNLGVIPTTSNSGWHNISLDHCMCVKEAHSNTARVLIKKIDDHLYFLNGLDINSSAMHEQLIINIMVMGLVLIVILGTLGGIIVSRNTLKRIGVINKTITEIRDGNLELRIPMLNSNDEYDLLARNINHMLEQIKTLLNNIQNISNHISHDLRTPLTRMRGKLEQLLIQNPNTGSAQPAENILDAIDEADNLLSAFNAILRISKVESGASTNDFSNLSITTLLNDVHQFYEPLASEKNIQIIEQSQDNIHLEGDRDMLFQAIANLFDNAIKYTPAGGTISLSLKQLNDCTCLSISDSGPGIPEKERDKVFQRFYQLSAHGGKGHGLGLALVNAIITHHQGEIELSDNNPGLTVSLKFSL